MYERCGYNENTVTEELGEYTRREREHFERRKIDNKKQHAKEGEHVNETG